MIERRRALGHDLYDEVWEGEYHIAPAAHPWHGYLEDELAALLRPLAQRVGLVGTGPFNLGAPGDFRVPDRGLHRALPSSTFVPTAALVVEIVSPDDETWNKLGFYAAHAVDEVLIVDVATAPSPCWSSRAVATDAPSRVRCSASPPTGWPATSAGHPPADPIVSAGPSSPR